MSHPLHELSTEELSAEIQRRKADEAKAIRTQIDEYKRKIAALEAQIGEKPAKATRTRSVKIDPVEADAAVLKALAEDVALLATSKLAEATGINGAPLKASLERLVAAGKVVRTGKARATVYGVA